MQIFRESIFKSECDQCKQQFPINTGGVCEQCRRILCGEHLHGSLARRVAIAFGARAVCVSCRAGVTPPPATTQSQ